MIRKCENFKLAQQQEEIELTNPKKAAEMSCYEKIGFILYDKPYGIDCYNYHIDGLPVNIEFIEEEMQNAKQVGMGIDLPPCAVYAWAKILNEYWDKYPNGIKEWKTELQIKELKEMVEALPPTGVEIYINNYVAKDWKDITISNINDCSKFSNPQSLLNDVGMRLHESYGIMIGAPIIINGKKYKIEYNYL